MNKKKPVKTNVKLSSGGKAKPGIQKAASKARRSANKKSGFNPVPLIFVAILVVGGFFAYKPIMNFIEESNRPKVVEVVKKEAPKKKKKKVIKKEAPKVVKKLEAPKFVKPKEDLFEGEIKHYTFSSVVKDRCFACHGEEGKDVEGKFDFVKFLASGKANPKAWSIIYNEISKGNMPPEDEKPLNDDEKEVLLTEIKKLTATDTVVRNTRPLTPNEIKNTVSDLFQVDSKVYDPFPRLFQNYTSDNFYTVQENVLTPYYLEDLYISLNDAITSYVSLDSRTDPIKMKLDFPTQVHRTFSKGSNYDLRWTHNNFLNEIHFTKYESKDPKKKKSRRETGPETKTDETLEKLTLPPGTYELSFKAQSQNMDPDKYPKKFGKGVVSLYKSILTGLDYGLPVDFYIAPPGKADAFAKSRLITTMNIDSNQMTEYKLKFTLNRRAAIAYRFPIKMPYDGSVAKMLATHMLGNSERKSEEEMLKKYMRVPNYQFAQVR
ncbi:MAG: hypothetical protein NE330_16935, partial [Lentisphaeraceae bacterium]|nr:hypothetical protein [Lentisphaeraceae bacterium]